MATATVVTAALAQEKIWLDKPSYDKAEKLHFEKMAKVVSRKVAGGGCMLKSDGSITNKYQDLISNNTLKSKTEKSKDNKSLVFENEFNENAKHTKCQARNVKANKQTAQQATCNMQNKKDIIASEKSDSAKDNAKVESIPPYEKSKKYNAKEAKEKKNKEDTRNKNRGSGGNNIMENKETVVQFARNKEQLHDQGNQQSTCPILPAGGSLANEVAKARQHIKQSLQCIDDIVALADVSNQDLAPRVANLEKDNHDLRNVIQDLRNVIGKLEERVKNLEIRVPYIAICPPKPESIGELPAEPVKCNDDEDIDLFGSDSEGDDAEAARIREERLAAYAAKKSKKPAVIAKSNIILDVKPWDDETDMKEMETEVRKIETKGLLWGASKLVPLAFGIHKLQISCVVEDDIVSIDWLTEQVLEISDYVQSVDIAAFNKV